MAEDRKGDTVSDKKGGERGDTFEQQRDSCEQSVRPGDNFASSGQIKIDFSTLIMSFASAAMISIGRMPDPVTGQVNKDLALARQNIDIISLLQEKTRGNLSPEEEKLVEGVLNELRISYVESQKR